NWNVPFVPALAVNLGASYTSRVFQQGVQRLYDPVTYALVAQVPYEFEEPDRLIWDVGFDYTLNKNFALNLFVENVGNTEHYATVTPSLNHIGNPRTAMLKVTWRDGGDRTGLTRSPSTGLAPYGNPLDWYGALDLGQQHSDDWEAQSSG